MPDAGVRLLLHTGKGGVGKTTTAAATAVRLAATGRDTLVVSTDPAHSLADALDTSVGDAPVAVAPHLDAQQLDSRARLDRDWHAVATYLRRLLAWGGADAVEAGELAMVPGLDELFALLELGRHASARRYDVVVVDCAPTAATLRLLTLPEALGWYVERVLPVQRTVTRALRPALDRLTSMPMPADGVLRAVEALHHRLLDVRALLLDPRVTSVRIVLTPEQVVLAEARRTHTLLGVFGYPVDAVVVNRVLGAEVAGTVLDPWRRRQQQQLGRVAEVFGPLPRLTAPAWIDEPVGVAALGALAEQLYARVDPAAVLHDGPRPEWVVADDVAALHLPLPDGSVDDVELYQHGDEVSVRIAGHTRSIVLPSALAGAAATSAAVEDGRLRIGFDRQHVAIGASPARASPLDCP